MSPRQDVGLRGPPRVSSPSISASASAAPSSDPRFVHAPFQAPPPVAVPPRSPREAAGTSASTRGARPRLLASRVWPLGDSAGGTESGRPQPPRPQSGSAGLRWPVTVPARATATRSASAPVPWAARVGGTQAPSGAPRGGPCVPATGVWRPLAATWGAPRRDTRGAANCQKRTKIGNGRS